jgi:tetratricopeptide (TPR) repeat protein
MDELRQILLLMTPDVVHALVRILAQTENPRIENMLVEIIAVQACRSSFDMSDSIRRLKPPLLRQLINSLKLQQDQYPANLLIKLTSHESDLVQEEAIRALLHLNPHHIVDIFNLIHTASPKIKHLLCLYLRQKLSPQAEELLLNYLKNSQKQNKTLDRDHILDCYRALARGTSPRVIHFLHETLLKKGWRSLLGIGNQIHRLGAALALMLMPQNEEAKIVLEKALRNSHLSITSAYWQAKEELNKTGKGRALIDVR